MVGSRGHTRAPLPRQRLGELGLCLPRGPSRSRIDTHAAVSSLQLVRDPRHRRGLPPGSSARTTTASSLPVPTTTRRRPSRYPAAALGAPRALISSSRCSMPRSRRTPGPRHGSAASAHQPTPGHRRARVDLVGQTCAAATGPANLLVAVGIESSRALSGWPMPAATGRAAAGGRAERRRR